MSISDHVCKDPQKSTGRNPMTWSPKSELLHATLLGSSILMVATKVSTVAAPSVWPFTVKLLNSVAHYLMLKTRERSYKSAWL